jgi:hypothetical protein
LFFSKMVVMPGRVILLPSVAAYQLVSTLRPAASACHQFSFSGFAVGAAAR